MRLADVFPDRPATGLDWSDLKRRIIAGLDLADEYAQLGLRIVGSPHNGKLQARAMGRDDDNPSAFVSLATGLYYAHGDPPEMLSFFDFALRYGRFGDWSEVVRHYAARAGVEKPIFRKSGKGWIEEARYPYRDRDGNLLFEVLRYRQPNGKKTFRQRQPDGSGGWRYDLDGLTRVLYRLPELLAHPDQPVWLVEGEKDADSLAELGLTATTAAQGAEAAGRKYWERGLYAPDLAGRDVVIVPDNDPPGLGFAHLVAGLLAGTAARVRLLELPEQPPKGDVTDWLEQGHGLVDLQALADACPDYDPASAAGVETDPSRDATAADLIAANAGTRWLWEGWLPLSVLTLLTAEPSTGKTRFCLDLNKRIAQLSQWPDGAAIQLPEGITPRVLWVAADHQHAELADAPAKFGFDPGCCLLNTTVSDLYGGTELQEPTQLDDLEARIKRLRPALVVIDTVTNTSDYKSQDTSDAKRQYKPLQEVAKRTGTAILCVTHLNVAGKTLGRRADEKTRVTIRLECPDPDGQPNRRKLSVALSRLSVYPPALGVTMGDAGNDYDASPPSATSEQDGAGMPTPAVQEAIGFLTARLAHGPARVSGVRREAENRVPPISARSLYRAKEILEVDEYEEQGRQWWRLAANGHPANGHAHADDLPPF